MTGAEAWLALDTCVRSWYAISIVAPRERLADCVGFQWDEGNATKNGEKHDVSQAECEEVFFL